MAEVGCRNTVFGAEAQTSPRDISKWHTAGLRHFRIEFVHQSPEQVAEIARGFRDYFDDSINADELKRHLAQHSPRGVTQGSLFVPENFKQLVQLI